VVASSATPRPLSEVHSRFASLVRAASPGSVSSCGPIYQSASCEVRRAIISPLTAFEVYILSRHLQASRGRRGRGMRGRNSLPLSLSLFLSLRALLFFPLLGCSARRERIRQKREGSACWIAEPRGVGARIKGAVRLEGAPNYDVTDRTRRDQVSRIQNGLLITEPPRSHSSDRLGGRHLPRPVSAIPYASYVKCPVFYSGTLRVTNADVYIDRMMIGGAINRR